MLLSRLRNGKVARWLCYAVNPDLIMSKTRGDANSWFALSSEVPRTRAAVKWRKAAMFTPTVKELLACAGRFGLSAKCRSKDLPSEAGKTSAANDEEAVWCDYSYTMRPTLGTGCQDKGIARDEDVTSSAPNLRLPAVEFSRV